MESRQVSFSSFVIKLLVHDEILSLAKLLKLILAHLHSHQAIYSDVYVFKETGQRASLNSLCFHWKEASQGSKIRMEGGSNCNARSRPLHSPANGLQHLSETPLCTAWPPATPFCITKGRSASTSYEHLGTSQPPSPAKRPHQQT